MHLVPDQVNKIDLSAPRIRDAFQPLRRYLRSTRPDTLIAAMWPFTVLAIVANEVAGRPTRVIVAEHCSLCAQYSASPWTYAALRVSIRATYRRAYKVIGVSTGVSEEVAELAGMKCDRVAVIHNPVPPPLSSGDPPALPWPDLPGKRILAVGRLKAQKNHALLIDAFARVATKRDVVLAIVGTGELEVDLRFKVNQLGLSDRILIPGFCATPADWYAGADLFVLSSDYEGFGNVLVEAMHHGLPVVSTDCPHGPSEVLGDGVFGLLVEPGNAAMLESAISRALELPRKPELQRLRAADFSVARAVSEYASLLERSA